MYVVLAKDSPSLQILENVPGTREMTAATDGERVFVVRRELKKD
jgi:20S proteasome subunit beta 6